MALVRKGDVGGAETDLVKLETLATDPDVATVKIWDLNTGTAILNIAKEVLGGEIAAAKGETETALAHFTRGVTLEANLLFDEPPSWYYPVRQSLGTLLLEQNRFAEAEEIFRQDLLKNAENPWSLFGLARCQQAQGETALAADTEKRFRRAWSRADFELHRPVF